MRYLFLIMSFVFLSTGALASEAPTKADAKALVTQAVAYAKANGRDKFFNEVRSGSGKFHFQEGTKKDLYIFVYDEKGTVLAHGVRLELTGKNRWNDKDPSGKQWVRDWTDLVHKRAAAGSATRSSARRTRTRSWKSTPLSSWWTA